MLVGLAGLCGCLRKSGPPTSLSEWKLFDGRLAELKPAANVVHYGLRTPLFSDYAEKDRVIRMPLGARAAFSPSEVYGFPVGTVIAKTFSYGGRRIETRVLNREAGGWVALPYVWNREQTDAVFELVPDPVQIEYRHALGETLRFEYVIPNTNQCKNCHENGGSVKPIGPKARHLEADVTLRLTGQAANPEPADTLARRARLYLDINCAHCHNPKGPANTSGLSLGYAETDLTKMGVCKTPVAAGQGSGTFRFSIVPGHPDESIVMHRMQSTMPKVQMPELGRSVVHREGVDLIRQWIQSLPGGCPAVPQA